MTDNEKRACSHLKVMSNSNINEYFVEYEDIEKVMIRLANIKSRQKNLSQPRVNHNT